MVNHLFRLLPDHIKLRKLAFIKSIFQWKYCMGIPLRYSLSKKRKKRYSLSWGRARLDPYNPSAWINLPQILFFLPNVVMFKDNWGGGVEGED